MSYSLEKWHVEYIDKDINSIKLAKEKLNAYL